MTLAKVVTLAFEDDNSTLLDVVSDVADFDTKECADDSLVKILKVMFGRDFETGYLRPTCDKTCSSFYFESTQPLVRCALGNVSLLSTVTLLLNFYL